MTSTFGSLTIGASVLRISTTHLGVAKLFIQVAPNATGLVKIGGVSTMGTDNTTPGVFLSPGTATTPGDDWVVEDQSNCNTVYVEQYYIHGTHAGDIVMWQYNQG